jgi:uncharacterized protein (DUF1501 family)
MLTFSKSGDRLCDHICRRGFLKAGALGIGGLTLADLLRLRAQGAVRFRSLKSIIMVYLHGGPSHIDTFDMKPDAPAEFRGEFRPIRTRVPGLDICELMPRLATIADRFSVIRNLSFLEYTDGHNPPLVYTGYRTSTAKPTHRPTFGSVVSRLRGDAVRDMPSYVAFDGFDSKPGRGTDYLGVAHRPFVPGEKITALGPVKGVTLERLANRKELLRSFDTLNRELDDASGNMAAMDAMNARALDMLTTPRARDAFDISKEPAAVRARYGKGGTQFLKARRLVEAGVQVVTLTANSESKTWDLAGPWDTHGANFKSLRKLLPELDQSLSALITDLAQRGLDQDVAVVVLGEMGRTPKVNGGAGRDHWNDAGFALVAGGGLKMGKVIGATTARAERPVGRPYTPQNMLATLYQDVLGINPATTLPGINGRPMYLLDNRDKITELV